MPFLATINTPGYMPWDDEPPTFETAREAWSYLRNERMDAEDYCPGDGYTATLNQLEQAERGEWDDLGLDIDGTGTVYGDTPGYDGDHDLGLAYSVTICGH